MVWVNGTELGTPGDEYSKSPWWERSPRLLHFRRRPGYIACRKIVAMLVTLKADVKYIKSHNREGSSSLEPGLLLLGF